MRQLGTYEVLVHAVLDLKYPIDEVLLFVLEATGVLGVFDGAQDADHTCGCPAVPCAGLKG